MRQLPPWLLALGALAVGVWGCWAVGEWAFRVGLFVVAAVMFLWAALVASTDGAAHEGP